MSIPLTYIKEQPYSMAYLNRLEATLKPAGVWPPGTLHTSPPPYLPPHGHFLTEDEKLNLSVLNVIRNYTFLLKGRLFFLISKELFEFIEDLAFI